MDEFEITKVAGSVLCALLLIFAPKAIIAMNSEHPGEKPGYTLPVGEPEGGKEKAAEAEKPKEPASADKAKTAAADDKAKAPAEPEKDAKADAKDKPAAEGDKTKTAAAAPAAEAAAGGDREVLALLPKANADNGKAIFRKCQACHVAAKGKTPTVGPNLWGVVNRPRASYPGFTYSDAMKAKGGDWSFDELAKFLHSPKTYIPGTKMVFNGLPTPNDEADVIAYLATLADTPVALPK